jgi:hypothetical protein
MSEEMPLIDPAAREKSRCTLAATGSQQEPRHGRRHTVLIWQLKADEVHALKSTEMNIFETVLGILLILAVGMCVVTFPFVFGCCLVVNLVHGIPATPRASVQSEPGIALARRPQRNMTRPRNRPKVERDRRCRKLSFAGELSSTHQQYPCPIQRWRLGGCSKSTHALVEESTDHCRSGQCDHPGDDDTSGDTPTHR